MHPFTAVRDSLRNWMTQYAWINAIKPYTQYILWGCLGYMMFYEIVYEITKDYVEVLAFLNSISYWGFLLGIFLYLIDNSIKYLHFALWGYVFQVLFPFRIIHFSNLLTAAVYITLGIFVFLYLQKVEPKPNNNQNDSGHTQ